MKEELAIPSQQQVINFWDAHTFINHKYLKIQINSKNGRAKKYTKCPYLKLNPAQSIYNTINIYVTSNNK
jgi:hypothetical protein